MTIACLNYPLSYYVEKMEQGAPFAFSRWGDGEFSAVLGYAGHNCDRHAYFPALGADLRKALHHRYPYAFALGPLVSKGPLGVEVEGWLNRHGIEMEWHNTDVFVQALIADELRLLIALLRRKRVHYVGPLHLFVARQAGTVAGLFPWQAMTVIPDRNCYTQLAQIRESILASVRQGAVEIVGLSAGMTSNVLIDQLWPEIGQDVVMVDFGSLWDGFAGKMSRSYHRKVNYHKRKKQ